MKLENSSDAEAVRIRENYQIREMKITRKEREWLINFRYLSGTHFLFLVMDCTQPQYCDNFQLERVLSMVSAEGSDAALVNSPKRNIFQTGDKTFFAYLIKKEEFAAKGFSALPSNFNPGVPYRILTFPCVYAAEEQILHVYYIEQNEAFFPTDIKPTIDYGTYAYGFLKKAGYAKVRLPLLPSYIPGALVYDVEGGGQGYPISREALGKDIFIPLPDKNAKILIKVIPQYKNYYRIAERQ